MNQAIVQQLLDLLNNPFALAALASGSLAGLRVLIEKLPWAHADSDLNALTMRAALYLLNLLWIIVISGAAGTLHVKNAQDALLLLVTATGQGILGHAGYAVLTNAKSASDASISGGAPPDGAVALFSSAQTYNSAAVSTPDTAPANTIG